ncbi:MAG: hypothetical protein HY042_13335 [Spirochaetia bacterium]|nr:hypothetical protein [Spirochaetia bacterium]
MGQNTAGSVERRSFLALIGFREAVARRLHRPESSVLPYFAAIPPLSDIFSRLREFFSQVFHIGPINALWRNMPGGYYRLFRFMEDKK